VKNWEGLPYPKCFPHEKTEKWSPSHLFQHSKVPKSSCTFTYDFVSETQKHIQPRVRITRYTCGAPISEKRVKAP
jgi:hypothetical protein